ncbi:peptidoglycan DD-metalloendopeptidase family protein [Kribbella sp. NBC_01245]|uniref:M23 family metallopeptidase n=1 Tax=Kribbella sp. NBC_01245 TaxID=2903578 RepID=UPI002E2AE04D|nr:M23 family metallopeptidase [Kribbella sp. NBC_01245]
MPLRRFISLLATIVVGAACLVALPTAAQAAPNFKAPFGCNQRWTYSHHSQEVRRALDFIRSDGGTTNGAPAVASAAGTATRHYEGGGAGNYVVIDHGGGWKTYYFHLSGFSISNGQHVNQGQQIGTTGSTGASSGPHLHYEQLYNGVGQNIRINGVALAYPSSYGSYHLTSDNCGGTGNTNFTTWGSGINVRSDAKLSASIVTTLAGPTPVYVQCQKQGDTVNAEGTSNNWWSKLRDQNGFISNIYIDHPAAQLPGVPICGAGVQFQTWGSSVNVRSDAKTSASIVTTINGPTTVWVLCQKQGDTVTAEGVTNNWWSKLRDQNGYMTNIYIDHPDNKLPGVPNC